MSPHLRVGALVCVLGFGAVAAYRPPVGGELPTVATTAVPSPAPPSAKEELASMALSAPAPTPAPRPTPAPTTRRDRRDRFPEPDLGPADWRPPEGPVRIALQAGHWRAHEAPSELSGLRQNGTRWEGLTEWENNLEIARRTRALLEEVGYAVDLLPAVVPPGYRAHLFIAIHADGHRDPAASGYRAASPRRDLTGRAEQFAKLLEDHYGEATGLKRIPTDTRRMENYYAFNYRRYEHALHPMTIGVILETGFLTSPIDRAVIVNDHDRVARAIVGAVQAFPETRLPQASTD